MTLKNAALFALIGNLLLTLVLAADFLQATTGLLGDVVPLLGFLRSLVWLAASLSVTVFFYVFHQAQGR